MPYLFLALASGQQRNILGIIIFFRPCIFLDKEIKFPIAQDKSEQIKFEKFGKLENIEKREKLEKV